ncbi:MAG: cell division protein FtsK [Ruminococcaceae bacterium]|nr:cell division protein FtsK [Oscillospiraceae bacterium]
MKALAQQEIVALVADLNAFADRAEAVAAGLTQDYEQGRAALSASHSKALGSYDAAYKANYTSVQDKSMLTITEARGILAEIDLLDDRLSKVDKYYLKTKEKKIAELRNVTNEKYDGATDYFAVLRTLKGEFDVLYKKYAEDILPGLLNGLNFLFSGKRKQDYEDLIILRNTVASFVSEIEEVLPTLTNDHLSALKDEYLAGRSAMTGTHKAESDAFEERYLSAIDAAADKICTDLDNILPDSFVDYLHAIMADHGGCLHRVNTSGTLTNEVLYMAYIDYPVDFFVQSKIVASVIKDKCAKILVNGAVRLPVMISASDAPAWMLAADGQSMETLQLFTHSVMYGMLCACPVGQLTFAIVDPENRGSSISPFFDARKKLPELFGERIFVSRDEITAKLAALIGRIEDMLQNRLGNQYDTVYDYAAAANGYKPAAELLVLYDFPRGFDERSLAELRNILRNGARCGIYTLIINRKDDEGNYSREFAQNLQAVTGLTTTLSQNGGEMLFHGLPLLIHPMPDKAAFSQFFSKYLLICEGIKNRGIAFPPFMRRLMETTDAAKIAAGIDEINEKMRGFAESYGRVPDKSAGFPDSLTLGSVLYPADVFADSACHDPIMEQFGCESRMETENTAFAEMPLTFELGSPFNLLLHAPETSAREMLTLSHHLIWSFLSELPVTKVNVCIFDAEQRGNSVIPFLDFRKRVPEAFDAKIYTSPDDICDRLRKINAQIDDFIQEKLGNRFRDILEYNRATPRRAEPVTLLMLYDFPAGMDGRSMDRLTSILRNGGKCGVYTVICRNPSVNFSRYDNMDDRMEQLAKVCASVEYRDGQYRLMPYNLPIGIPDTPTADDADDFAAEYAKQCEAVKKQGLSFGDILPRQLFAESSAKKLSIPVGVGDGDSIVNLTIGEGSSHHGLIAGATGSGKSTLLHTIIMSSMLAYSPDELNLYLMDFKSGTEFKIYESVRLPHIKLLALDAMQEFGESILERLVAEMEHRGTLFKEAGQTSISGYTREAGKPMPRILVIMDEFQILFNDSANRKVAMHCAELAKRIVTEGRAFGIHLLMATQSTKVISDLTLSHGTVEQMRIRIGLKCAESDARYLFADNDAKALTMMKGPIGTAVMNPDYTEAGNIGFRAAYCDADTQKAYLEKISLTFADYPYTLQTFEGGRTTSLAAHFAAEGIVPTSELPVRIHMGELIKVAPPFVTTIDKKRRHNLLVCGASEKMANTVADGYMISALTNRNAEVYLMDGDLLVGDGVSETFYDALSVCGRLHIARERGDIIRFVNELYQSYSERKKHGSDDVTFVVIRNLQFLDLVKAMMKGEMIDESEYLDESEEAFDPADPFAAVNSMFAARDAGDSGDVSQKLIRMMADGSGYGIHFVVTCLEYQTVKECMYYGENLLSRFPERVIFSLAAGDADSLIEGVSVAGLRDNTVYYTDGVKNTFQLKPYTIPEPDEIRRMME